MNPDGRPTLDVIACTLPPAEAPDRLSAWHAVAARAMAYDTTRHGLRLLLPAEPELCAQVAELVRLEQQCCTFFTFSTTEHGGVLLLDVSAPDEARGLIHDLLGWQPG